MTLRVGDTGTTTTRMSPSGKVLIGGREYHARADGMFMPAGAACVVVRGDPAGPVVRPLPDGGLPEPLADHGRPIRKPETGQNTAEAAATTAEQQHARRAQLRRATRHGAVAAAALGGMVGLGSGGLGAGLGWVALPDPGTLAVLLAGSCGVGVAVGAVLFLVTGWVGAAVGRLFGGGDGFAPSFLAVAAGLGGAAVGFWRTFPEADPAVVAGATALYALGAAAVGWLVGAVVGSFTG